MNRNDVIEVAKRIEPFWKEAFEDFVRAYGKARTELGAAAAPFDDEENDLLHAEGDALFLAFKRRIDANWGHLIDQRDPYTLSPIGA